MPTVNGKVLSVRAGGMGVMVNGAKVVATDLVGSNGVIHGVDTVIPPVTTSGRLRPFITDVAPGAVKGSLGEPPNPLAVPV